VVVTLIFGAVAFLVGQWWTEPAQTRVEVIADWINMPTAKYQSASDINKPISALGYSAVLGEGVSGSSRFVVAKVDLHNPTAITSKEVELYIKGAYFGFDPDGNGRLLSPKRDGQFGVGRFLPESKRTLLIFAEDKSYLDGRPSITVISDGVKLPVDYRKSADDNGTAEWLRKAYERNGLYFDLFAAWSAIALIMLILILAFIPVIIRTERDQDYRVKVMDKKTRARTIADADYIRRIFPEEFAKEVKSEEQPK
jgi:hypothetical protein